MEKIKFRPQLGENIDFISFGLGCSLPSSPESGYIPSSNTKSLQK